MDTKARHVDVDIVKGIAIILMVLGHSGVSEELIRFIYLFHMAVFVIAAGYCYNEKYSQGGWGIFLKKRVKSLYIPFVCWMFVLTIMHNSCIFLNIYTDSAEFLSGSLGNEYGTVSFYSAKDIAIEIAKAAILCGREQLFGASWFIRVMFYMSITWCAVDNILVKVCRMRLNTWRILISLILLFVGNIMIQYDILNYSHLRNIFTSYILFTIGVSMRKLWERYGENISYKTIAGGLVGGLCILLGVYFSHVHINMVSFDNAGGYVMASWAGWIFLHAVSLLIERTNGVFTVILGYVGRNTLPIVLFHFLCFKVVTCVEILVYHLPWFRLASFPTYRVHPIWWILYTLSGVMIPLAIAEIFHKAKNRASKAVGKDRKDA